MDAAAQIQFKCSVNQTNKRVNGVEELTDCHELACPKGQPRDTRSSRGLSSLERGLLR